MKTGKPFFFALGLAATFERLAKLPLAYQPGTTWDYSYSTDVLGRVVEVVTGKTLLQAMKERLLDPLGMTDTTFLVYYQ